MEMPDLKLSFSVSATSRPPRGTEKNGCEYYFLSPEEFDRSVSAGEFVEWEEVYAGTKYGTLRSEIQRIITQGRNVIMDIDVKGALNVKKQFGPEALSVFILPPSEDELEKRLRNRATDSEESIAKRLEKAEYELKFAPGFDLRIVNGVLDDCVCEVSGEIRKFCSGK